MTKEIVGEVDYQPVTEEAPVEEGVEGKTNSCGIDYSCSFDSCAVTCMPVSVSGS